MGRFRTVKQFVRKNRKEIDLYIGSVCRTIKSFNDELREDWIINEEFLYRWAKSRGVRDI
jgi:hypothetical protein